ncbi:MAG TPA: hypothetical protein QF802_00360 [Candidatus Thalassarchaeaceae archaeon]|nr:hypothetical protein [Candidatus Thalassarchaeaceae archaeon]
MQLLNKSEEIGEMVDSKEVTTLTMEDFAKLSRERADSYHRYHINAKETMDRQALPNRFLVKVGKIGLAKLIASETFHYWGKWDVVFSRPCTYGVFSGPVGGFSPRPEKCVGCLRCTVQHPEFVKVEHNPARAALGDSYLNSTIISTIDEEARKGTVPVRGQGYRGRFGGPGWDEMFTDMSEIVRPSRDGIHGRELISTAVDIGSKPMSLKFDGDGNLVSEGPKMISIQVPFVFDAPPSKILSPRLASIWMKAAEEIDTLVMLPANLVSSNNLASRCVVPIIPSADAASAKSFKSGTRMVELDNWDSESFTTACSANPDLIVGVRLPFAPGWQQKLEEMIEAEVSVIHFIADNHGKGDDGRFIMDMILEAHKMLIAAGLRDKITLLNSGGVVAADHLPKAIICGLDAVCLDLPLLVAMQARLSGDLSSRDNYRAKLPRKFKDTWATQRIVNLSCSWRDQMLEILGAMGIREVRRLRGEVGRAMWCSQLEKEAFADIEGFTGGDE